MVQAINPVSAPTSTAPFDILFSPAYWVADKVKEIAKAFFGSIVRIVTFQMGEMQNAGASAIMSIYSYLLEPPDIKAFDRARLNRSRDLLAIFGGNEIVVDSVKGNKIHLMTFTSERFFTAFADMGSHPIEVEFEGRRRRALLNPPEEAKKFYFQVVEVRMLDGSLQTVAILPESPRQADVTPHIFHSHSPGRSMCMDRRFLGLHLAAGYNVTVWDPPGTVDSEGRASEGSYYKGAEAVLGYIMNTLHVPVNRIYVSGFCEGAACAAHLKRLHHREGINFIGSNPYTSMADVITNYGWLAKKAVQYGINALQDPTIDVPQDNFNNVRKFQNLPESQGKFVICVTDTDQMMPRRTLQELADAVGDAGPFHEIVRCHPDPSVNGHMEPPYQDRSVWRRYVRWVN